MEQTASVHDEGDGAYRMMRVGGLGYGLSPAARGEALARLLTLVGCFFLSWQLIRVPQVNFTLSDGAIILALAILLLSGRLNPSLFGRLTGLWIFGVLLMLAGLFAGSIVHGLADRWLLVAAQYFIALMVLPVVMTSFGRDFLHQCGLAFASGVAGSQILGILALQFFGYHALTPYVGRTVVLGNDRIGAMTAEPNANGAVCVFAVIIVLAALLEKRLRLPAGLLIIALCLAGLAFSASFTSILALVLSTALIGLLTWSTGAWRIGVPLIMAAVFYVGLGGPLPEVFLDRVGEAIVDLDLSQAGTFVSRAELMGEAWRLADGNLVLGLGVDRFREASIHGAPVHNLPLLLLNEGGVISFLGLAALLLCLLTASILLGRTDRLGGVICFAALFVALIYVMSLPHMYARHWFGPVILIFAAYMMPRVRSGVVEPSGEPHYDAALPGFAINRAASK